MFSMGTFPLQLQKKKFGICESNVIASITDNRSNCLHKGHIPFKYVNIVLIVLIANISVLFFFFPSNHGILHRFSREGFSPGS